MLIFLDESYETDDTGQISHAYGGFGIDETRYRGLVVAVFQAKMRYCMRDTGFSDEQRRIVRRTHILTAEPPERSEMKATKLLTAKQAQYYAEHGSAPGIDLATLLPVHSSQISRHTFY